MADVAEVCVVDDKGHDGSDGITNGLGNDIIDGSIDAGAAGERDSLHYGG